ncbi:MAG: hypothetical protein MRY83_05955, partial [Flavobacteriales bacterium]|nr:hypothetical protein [Flavobacteriales bacterium]
YTNAPISNAQIHLDIPPGAQYVPGTIIGGSEFNIFNLNSPVFLVANLPANDTTELFFNISADCSIIGYQGQSNDLVIENTVTTSGDTATDLNEIPFNLSIPNLVFTIDSNQLINSFKDSIGWRSFTVTNTGLGGLESLFILDKQVTGDIIIDSTSQGYVNSGSDTIWLTSADFVNVGDGDSLLEYGESIYVIEYFTVNACDDIESKIIVGWGCNGMVCQSNNGFCNVLVTQASVSLKYHHFPEQKSCIGGGEVNHHSMQVINQGLAFASNVRIRFRQYDGGSRAKFDTASFKYRIGVNGPLQQANPSIIWFGAGYSCLNAVAPGITDARMVQVIIPLLNPNDTVFIEFDSYNCCEGLSCNVGNQNLRYLANRIYYQLWYTPGTCGNEIHARNSWLLYPGDDLGLYTESRPLGEVEGGDTVDFTFFVSYHRNTLANHPSRHYRMEFEMPPCFKWSGNLSEIKWVHPNGTSVINPYSASQSGDTIIAYFSNWYGTRSEIQFELVADCNAPNCAFTGGGYGSLPYYFRAYYTNDTTCANVCEMQANCKFDSVFVLCPGPCNLGLGVMEESFERENYGLPDNDNDGIPDASGALDMDKVQKDLFLFGDTILQKFKGRVITDATHPHWENLYGEILLTNGTDLKSISNDITIYDVSTGVSHACNYAYSSSTTGSNVNDLYDFSVNSLTNCSPSLPANFVYEQDDSLLLENRYIVANNLGWNALKNITTMNEFYASDSVLPSHDSLKIMCRPYFNVGRVIGYRVQNYAHGSTVVPYCSDIEQRQSIRMSVGPSSYGMHGGNLFEYEYRNIMNLDSFTIYVPPITGFKYKSARIYQYRTGGTGVSPGSGWFNINPVNPNPASGILEFDLDQAYIANGGLIHEGDEGWHHYIYVQYEMDCSVPVNVTDYTVHSVKYDPQDEIANLDTNYSSYYKVASRPLTVRGPELDVEPTFPTIQFSEDPSWEFEVTNTSTTNANYSWILLYNNSGKIIPSHFIDLTHGDTLTSVNSYYHIGTFERDSITKYRLEAAYSDCKDDTMFVFTGFACDTFPMTIADAISCNIPQQDTLIIRGLPEGQVQISVDGPDEKLALCDTSFYEATITNVGEEGVYGVEFVAELVTGLSVVSGITEFKYPLSGSYNTISDPVTLPNNKFSWSLSAANLFNTTDKLLSFYNNPLNQFAIKFGVVTSCDYQADSIVGFRVISTDSCGNALEERYFSALAFETDTIVETYHNDISVSIGPYSPCSNSSIVEIVVVPDDIDSVGNNDEITVLLPEYLEYLNGSFVGISHPPGTSTPQMDTINNQILLTWFMPNTLVSQGDSVHFTFEIFGNKDSLTCDTLPVYFSTKENIDISCPATAKVCNFSFDNGDAQDTLIIDKNELVLINTQAAIVAANGNTEDINLSFDIINFGQSIISGHITTVSIYDDSDGNGVYSTSDSLRNTIALNSIMAAMDTLHFDTTVQVLNSQSCSLIAVIDGTVNPCMCPSSLAEILIPVQFTDSIWPADGMLCELDSIQPNQGGLNGNYLYNWNLGSYFSDSTIAQPWLINISDTIDSLSFTLTVDRNGCLYSDTIEYLFAPLPDAQILDDTIYVCASDTALSAALLVYPDTGIWTIINGNPTIADSIDPKSQVSNIGLGQHQLNWNVANAYCGSDNDTITLIKEYFPVELFGDTFVCSGDSIQILLDSNKVSYQYTWTPGINLSDSLISQPWINNSQTNFDTLTYGLLVQSNGCSSEDSLNVILARSPDANILDDTLYVCDLDTSLSGNVAIYPDTGIWALNYGNLTIVDSIDPNTSVLNVAYGAHLLSWQVSNDYCSADQDTILLIKEYLPTEILGDSSVCSGDSIHIVLDSNNLSYNYSWSPGINLSDSAISEPWIINAQSNLDTLSYDLIVESNGCYRYDTLSIVFAPSPSAHILDDTIYVCNSDTAVLASTPFQPNQGIWSQVYGANIFIADTINPYSQVTNIKDGEYVLTWSVTNAYCPGAIDSIRLIKEYLPRISYQDSTVCHNDSIQLTLDSNYIFYNYNWTPGINLSGTSVSQPWVINNSTGFDTIVYTVVVESNGCFDSSEVEVYFAPDVGADAGDSIRICFGDTALNAVVPIHPAYGVWYVMSGDTALISDSLNANSSISNLGVGTHMFEWVIHNGYCPKNRDTVHVIRNPFPKSIAGSDQFKCFRDDTVKLFGASS